MEAIRAIIRGDLSPVGNKIIYKKSELHNDFIAAGYSRIWVDSGTSALALALLTIKTSRAHIAQPKVIIPGYCCPDLVSAAVFAGLIPVAVDMGINETGYDLVQLRSALQSDVIAVIAINFLGIAEQLAELRALTSTKSIALIEDNAQWFPDSSFSSTSDFVTFSFGRGKPVSLLGGGLLLAQNDYAQLMGENRGWLSNGSANSIKYKLKLLAYNQLLKPQAYALLNRLPLLSLGQTKYHPLGNLAYMGADQKDIFAANYANYRARDRSLEDKYKLLFDEFKLQTLSSFNGLRAGRLLRFPLLCPSKSVRDLLLQQGSALGLGVSAMYQTTIEQIQGVADLVKIHGSLANASSFAGRFISLPVHERVSATHLDLWRELLASLGGASN